MSLSNWADFKFDFFGYGKVDRSVEKTPTIIANPVCTVFFKIDLEGEIVPCSVSFERLPFIKDPYRKQAISERTSMAVEIANILVSQVANRFAATEATRASMSPPEVLELQLDKNKLLLGSIKNALDGGQGADYIFAAEEDSIRMTLVCFRKEGNT